MLAAPQVKNPTRRIIGMVNAEAPAAYTKGAAVPGAYYCAVGLPQDDVAGRNVSRYSHSVG